MGDGRGEAPEREGRVGWVREGAVRTREGGKGKQDGSKRGEGEEGRVVVGYGLGRKGEGKQW